MNKIEIYKNWCEIDQLNGINLEDGEVLKVKWPNGEITVETIILEKTSYQVSDHGHPWDVAVNRAYAQTECRGVKCLLRLSGKDILCERV